MKYNKVVYQLLLNISTIIFTKAKVIWNIRPSNNYGILISPMWMQFPIILNTCAIFYEHNISHTTNMSKCVSPKAYSLAFPILGKHYPILFTFNAWFSNQWRCRITNLAKVHVNYQTLKCINILHIEIPKPMMSKFTCIIFFPWLYKIGCIRSMHSQYIHLSWIVLLTHSNK